MIKLKDLVEQLNIYNINDDYYIFEDEFKLNEGLITTWPIKKTVSILKSKGVEVDEYDNNMFHVIIYPKSKLNFLQTLQITNNFGWFPAYMYLLKNNVITSQDKYKYNVVGDFLEDAASKDAVLLRFEAKYDIAIDDVPKFLYHATSREKAIKIMKMGLSPKTDSQISIHPERIYLGTSPESVENMLRQHPYQASKKSRDGEFRVLQVNTSMIPRYFKIFRDPNATKFGVYTLNNIPPSAISVVGAFHIKL